MLGYVRTWGDPESPTIVFFPGAGGTQWLWTPHAELLANEYRVVAVDMPAHGVHPDASFSVDRAISDVGEVLDEEGSAVLVGHSLGGQIATAAASAHANRIDGLLVAGVSSQAGLLKRSLQLPVSYVIEAAAHSTRIREWMDEQYGLDNERQMPPESANSHDEAVAMARSIRGTRSLDALSTLESYEGPTMLTYGKDEKSRDEAEKIAERAGAQLKWYSGGHGYPSRHPEDFSEIVETFLDEIYAERK